MKKNTMMRFACMVLVLTLLSTCTISGTFAKYTTDASAADSARVAKFGVAIQTAGTLYSDAYVAGTPGVPASAWSEKNTTANGITVAAYEVDDNVVAPGTESYGHGLSFGITGKPEVTTKYYGEFKTRDIFLKAGEYAIMTPTADVKDKVAFDAVVNRLYYDLDNQGAYKKVEDWNAYQALLKLNEVINFFLISNIVTATDYYPVVYTMTSENGGATFTPDKDYEVAVDASTTDPIAKALTKEMTANGEAVEAKYDEATTEKTWTVEFVDAKEIATNVELASEYHLGTKNITWGWAYGEKPVSITEDEADHEDLMDTILGDMMAQNTNHFVVCKVGSTYKNVEYDNENMTVKSNGVIVASLKTSFELKLRVTQVD